MDAGSNISLCVISAKEKHSEMEQLRAISGKKKSVAFQGNEYQEKIDNSTSNERILSLVNHTAINTVSLSPSITNKNTVDLLDDLHEAGTASVANIIKESSNFKHKPISKFFHNTRLSSSKSRKIKLTQASSSTLRGVRQRPWLRLKGILQRPSKVSAVPGPSQHTGGPVSALKVSAVRGPSQHTGGPVSALKVSAVPGPSQHTGGPVSALKVSAVPGPSQPTGGPVSALKVSAVPGSSQHTRGPVSALKGLYRARALPTHRRPRECIKISLQCQGPPNTQGAPSVH